ncbi:MAG TPA: tRNA guanosine(34) transglycosylase Tgt [Vicinamibacterales bacterium]|nr:tRNA guanosine(34) transglycosylase Tgt [Acidobacteriota bacterium]HOC16619.1 tRNA guanosine(34) transglycosylase Tgt [Vicinamibacterales bacterium]
MAPVFTFRLTHTCGEARRGEMVTAHGPVQTPAFMPVGTQGAVKGVLPRDLHEMGAEILLANTYHLSLRPGDARIARLGGLHAFSGWDRAVLTDSGGFQAFSLGDRRTIDEEGVRFRSHLDGSPHQLTPEGAADIQARLGSDIAMVLDECLAFPAERDHAAASMERTARWAARARARFLELSSGAAGEMTNPGQAQFGIVQGGVFPDLRRVSAEATVAVGFEAYAIGGLSVGEPAGQMYDVVACTAPLLPADRPRYLMGTGTPLDLVEGVARGIDLFDCVLPTRNARNGQLFTSSGRLNIKNAAFADDPAPIEEGCGCYACRHFSRAYLRHLHLAGEIGASTLNTLHNLWFYLDTMRRIREALVFGSFDRLRQDVRQVYSPRVADS